MRDSVRQLGVQLHGWPTWYSVAVRGRYSVTHRCARGRSSSTARRDRLIHRVVVFCAAERREFTLIGGTVVVVIMGCGVALLNVRWPSPIADRANLSLTAPVDESAQCPLPRCRHSPDRASRSQNTHFKMTSADRSSATVRSDLFDSPGAAVFLRCS